MHDSAALERLSDTVVGTVTLRASDTGRLREFYERGIGLTGRDGDGDTIELEDAAGRALIRLDSATAHGSEPLARPHTGLFHNAFRYPDRAALGAAVKRTAGVSPNFEGASDHGVSEAVYFRDPEGNGVELYRDRAYEEWPQAAEGRVGMYTRPLDLAALVAEVDPDAKLPATCDIGHIHLMTADVEAATAFWRNVIGLDERQRFGSQAVFLAEGAYHHHIGANTWHSAGAAPAPPDRPGLEAFELRLRSTDAVGVAAERLAAAGHEIARADGAISFRDPDANRVAIRTR